MAPSEFFGLHPQEFWWAVEGWHEQDNQRRNPNGLSRNDKDRLKAMAMKAAGLHAQGEWKPTEMTDGW